MNPPPSKTRREKYLNLIDAWSKIVKPKPLLLWGARQVGKTTLMRDFASNYSDHVYLNFETDKSLAGLFSASLDPEKILRNLSLYFERPIRRETTLLVFDEIQECEDALNSLKYFAESLDTYRVIAAGSLLGVKHSKKGFPVGQVTFLDVHPLSFIEFLEMTGSKQLATYIEGLDKPEAVPAPIHLKLIEKVREYMWVGGMPEVVAAYTNDPKNFEHLRTLQNQITRTYQLDFAKYAPSGQVAKIGEIFAQIPLQIAKENRKFQISGIRKNARLREYGEALQWLVDAGIVHKVSNISDVSIPLAAHANHDVFKLFLIDVGLLGAMLDVPAKLILDQEYLFSNYKGALAESYVAQQLIAHQKKELYYWTKGANAEVDFVIQEGDGIFPLEVKSGVNTRSKSLTQFAELYHSKIVSRCNTLNYRKNGIIVNYPFYDLVHFPSWTEAAI